MRHPLLVRSLILGSFLAGLGAYMGCTDENVIFKERPFFEDPPTGAAGFLGYDEQAAKLTVCGNCHVGKQAEWQGTAHADAWEGLQGSGSAQAFCETCHTVSASGNPAQGDVGWTATGDPRYHDVQCESCHGPGSGHIANPDASQPLASILVGTEVENSCGECHSGTHHGFVDEWERSPHANVVTFAAAREECAGCHRGQATLRAWGENANYVEKESAEPLPVVCAVCHDPHDARNEGQLRFPVNTPSIEEHLCARCHNRRTEPTAASHGLEPHAPEAALLVGDAGWFPPGAGIDQGDIRGTHGTERNTRLCATCHLPMFEVSDPESGDHVFTVTGHLFRPIPCVDEQGVPLPFEESCELSTSARSFRGCTESGCHGDAGAALSAISRAVPRIQQRADELIALLEEVDGNLGEPGGEIDDTNPTFTVAEGAFFNYNLAIHGDPDFGTDTVLGSAVHNPFLMEALLVASIDAVETTYGVSLSVSVDWDAELQRVLERAGR